MSRQSHNAIERIKKIASMSEADAKAYLRNEKRAEPEEGSAGSLKRACSTAPITLIGRGSDGNAHIVYLSDGTKISVGRDRTTKGPAWLEISQQAKITAQ